MNDWQLGWPRCKQLSDKDFKVAIIHKFCEIRKNTLEINGKIKVLGREIEIVKKKKRNKSYTIWNELLFLNFKNSLPLPSTMQPLSHF